MRSLLLSRRDLDFLLYEWLDVEALTARPRFAEHSRETFDARARSRRADRDRALRPAQPDGRRRRAAGSTASGSHMIPEVERGAAGVRRGRPRRRRRWTRQSAACSCRTTVAPGRARLVPGRERRHRGLPVPHRWPNANLLLAHGSPEQIETFVAPMLEGRFFGTMCLSEPQAGSSLADITTRAEPQRRRHLPADRQQDVDLRRRPRAEREHRPPGAGQDPRRPAGREGHLAVHRPQVPGRCRRLARRAQRRRAGRAEPQDGLPRHRRTRC